MSDGGKGSAPRPFSVDQKTFDENFDRIFGKHEQRKQETDRADQQDSHGAGGEVLHELQSNEARVRREKEIGR